MTQSRYLKKTNVCQVNWSSQLHSCSPGTRTWKQMPPSPHHHHQGPEGSRSTACWWHGVSTGSRRSVGATRGGLGVGGGGFSRRRRRAYCTYSADERERDLTWSPEDLLISSPTSVLLMQEGIRMRWWLGRGGRWAGGRKKTKKKERPSSDHLLSAATAPVRTDSFANCSSTV